MQGEISVESKIRMLSGPNKFNLSTDGDGEIKYKGVKGSCVILESNPDGVDDERRDGVLVSAETSKSALSRIVKICQERKMVVSFNIVYLLLCSRVFVIGEADQQSIAVLEENQIIVRIITERSADQIDKKIREAL